MAVSRADRRADREARVLAVFGSESAPAVLDLFELVELAWHDCYSEVSPSEDLIDDVLLLSGGELDKLVRVALLAVADWRDVKVAATDYRTGRR